MKTLTWYSDGRGGRLPQQKKFNNVEFLHRRWNVRMIKIFFIPRANSTPQSSTDLRKLRNQEVPEFFIMLTAGSSVIDTISEHAF